mmetsp:Transcript_24376/g.77816  ORF Transcript_24376/g.77816 Transcript_24376/m.77816 type:complete len:203 (+) Transcript_24376:2766-3374(+)
MASTACVNSPWVWRLLFATPNRLTASRNSSAPITAKNPFLLLSAPRTASALACMSLARLSQRRTIPFVKRITVQHSTNTCLSRLRQSPSNMSHRQASPSRRSSRSIRALDSWLLSTSMVALAAGRSCPSEAALPGPRERARAKLGAPVAAPPSACEPAPAAPPPALPLSPSCITWRDMSPRHSGQASEATLLTTRSATALRI